MTIMSEVTSVQLDHISGVTEPAARPGGERAGASISIDKHLNKIYKVDLPDYEGDLGKNIARVATVSYGKFIFVFQLYVEPEHRGNGYARALMQRVIEDYGHRELRLIPEPYQLKVDKIDGTILPLSALETFYTKLGFKKLYTNAGGASETWHRPGQALQRQPE